VVGLELNHPPGGDHGVALATARALGVGATQLTLPWSVLEPDAGQLDVSLLAFGLGFYRAEGLDVLLSIPVIDTIEPLMPADLEVAVEGGALSLADPLVQTRLELLLANVLAVAGPELSDLVLANEIDIALASRPPAWWSDLTVLVDAGRNFVRASRPDVRVGVSATFGGLSEPRLGTLSASHDARYVTYYVAGNFGGGSQGSSAVDLARMLTYANGKPLVLKECGYATGAALGGSPAAQATFVRQLFAAWDQHATEVPLIVLSRMYDGVRADCEAQAVYYGLPGDEAFIQFLCTLGLRSLDDQPKPGWRALERELGRRGF
jgi:hypothetical protein